MEGCAPELLMEESAIELVHRVQQHVETVHTEMAAGCVRLAEAGSSPRKACAGTERGLRSQLAEGCAALFATQVQQERGITCGWVASCGSLTYFGSRMAGRRASTDTALTDQLARTFLHVASELAQLRAEVDSAVVRQRGLAEQAAARPACPHPYPYP